MQGITGEPGRRRDDVLGRLFVSITGEPERALRMIRREIIVGRSTNCDLKVLHLACSNRHLRFYVTFFDEGVSEPLVFCEDLNSTNGTYVNGRNIGTGASVLLFTGDSIEIPGAAKFVFQSTQIPEDLDQLSKKDQNLFSSSYQLTNRLLGSGSFGQVYVAWENHTHRQMACKIVDMKKYLTKAKTSKGRATAWTKALREVDILEKLSHPNIINIKTVFRTSSRIYIFEELIAHGDLFSFMAKREVLEEIEALPIVWQILKALEYLHRNGISHRDLKPENILLASEEVGGRVVLADFGSAHPFTTTRMVTYVGTAEFSAPEIFRETHQGYSKAVDLWSFGAIIYNLLIFRGEHTPSQLTTLMRDGELGHMDYYRHITNDAKDFIKRLICKDPKTRMTAKQAMKHNWLVRHEKELDALYARATKSWKGRDSGVMIKAFDTTTEDEQISDGIARGYIASPPCQSDIGLSNVPDLAHNNYSPPSLEEPKAKDWAENLYSASEQSLHDMVSSDGRLRNAAELAREVEARRGKKMDDIIVDRIYSPHFTKLSEVGRTRSAAARDSLRNDFFQLCSDVDADW